MHQTGCNVAIIFFLAFENFQYLQKPYYLPAGDYCELWQEMYRMDDWIKTIVYGFIVYFIYKANSKIMKLEGSQIFERPPEWSYLTWRIYLLRNSIKPKSINMPFGM